MKLLAKIIVTCTFFCSCTNSGTYIESDTDTTVSFSQTNKDTLRTVDSAIIAQSKVVYGDLKFGATKEEYDKVMKDLFQEVGDETYSFWPFYNSDKKLYMLGIEGFTQNANYLDNRVYDQMNNLKQVISEKYGEAEAIFPYPSIFDFTPGYINWTNLWSVGTKKIKVGVMEVSSGSEYRAVCRIYDEPMYEEMEKERETKSNEKKSGDANKF